MKKHFKKIIAIATTGLMSLAIVFNANAVGNPVIYNDWQSGNAASECSVLGSYSGAYKIDAAAPNGIYNTGQGNIITISNSDGNIFDWSSTAGIGAVIVKAGTGANVWLYNPQETSDEDLYAYENRNVSHVTFCWNHQLVVTKTAETSFSRDWTWEIFKSVDLNQEIDWLDLMPGLSYEVLYNVKVSADKEDSDWAVEGEIEIYNPAPIAATITGVTDNISGFGAATVNCGVSFPYVLGSEQTLTCTYYATDLADGADRLNTATVTTSGSVLGSSGTADVEFDDPTDETDECIDVTDSIAGDLGEVCEDDLDSAGEYEFDYGVWMGTDLPTDFTPEYFYRLICGENDVINVASLVSNDTNTTDEAEQEFTTEVHCVLGCTLTQGYWKTHSSYGKAPYDDNWAQIGEDTTFFLSGQSYYQVLWTPVKGNAYYQLAHQYIAAELNKENGANVPDGVQSALVSANTLFETYTPAQILALKGKNATDVRQQFVNLAGILGSYNEGLIGPGHCSE